MSQVCKWVLPINFRRKTGIVVVENPTLRWEATLKRASVPSPFVILRPIPYISGMGHLLITIGGCFRRYNTTPPRMYVQLNGYTHTSDILYIPKLRLWSDCSVKAILSIGDAVNECLQMLVKAHTTFNLPISTVVSLQLTELGIPHKKWTDDELHAVLDKYDEKLSKQRRQRQQREQSTPTTSVASTCIG